MKLQTIIMSYAFWFQTPITSHEIYRHDNFPPFNSFSSSTQHYHYKRQPLVSIFSLFQEKPMRPLASDFQWRGQKKIKAEFKQGRMGERMWEQIPHALLTIEAGEVSPVKQGAVEGGQGDVEERIGAVGWVSDVVGEQVHLQQGLDQIAQHLAAQRDLHSLPLVQLSLTVFVPF